MDDIKLAMLGDHEAAKRLTEAGVLVPCKCGGAAGIIRTRKAGVPSGDDGWCVAVKCNACGETLKRWALKKSLAEASARLAWNTRAAILSAEEMEMLERME